MTPRTYIIGGVRYIPLERAYDSRSEGAEAWRQRLLATLARRDSFAVAEVLTNVGKVKRPARACVDKRARNEATVAEYVRRYPGCTVSELIDAIGERLISASSHRNATVRRWLKDGGIKGVRTENENRVLRLWPAKDAADQQAISCNQVRR